MSARATGLAPQLAIDQARELAGGIAADADVLSSLLAILLEESEDADKVGTLGRAAQTLADRLGWLADLAAKRLGDPGFRSGAEERMTWPSYRKAAGIGEFEPVEAIRARAQRRQLEPVQAPAGGQP